MWGLMPDGTFDVPVDDHVAVQVGHALQNLSGILACHILCQSPISLQLVFDWTLRVKDHSTSESHRTLHHIHSIANKQVCDDTL